MSEDATFEESETEEMANKKFKRQTVRKRFRENIRKRNLSRKKLGTSFNSRNGYTKTHFQVVKEILKLSKRMRIAEQTSYLALCYYEQYLSSDFRKYLPHEFKKKISNNSLLAAVILFLSCKLNDVQFPGIRELAGSHGRQFEKDIIQGERLVFEKMDFEYIQESPFVLFKKYFISNRVFVKKCCDLFERCSLQNWSLLYGWDMIARAIIYTLDSDIIPLENCHQRVQIKDLSSRIKQMETQIF